MSENLSVIPLIRDLDKLVTEIELKINSNKEVEQNIQHINNEIARLEAEEEKIYRQLVSNKLVAVEGVISGRSMKVAIILTPIDKPFPTRYIKLAKKSGIKLSKIDNKTLVIATKKTYTLGLLKVLKGKFDSWTRKIKGE